MDFMTFVYGGYVIVAIVVAVFAIRILHRDARERREAQEDRRDDAAKLAAISAKAHRHVVEEQEKSRSAFSDQPPVIDVVEEEHGSWFDAALAKQAKENAVADALDKVILHK